MAHDKVTLTGTFTRLDGTPATGSVKIAPSRSPIMDPDAGVILAGPQVFPLDPSGKISVELPASNDPSIGEAFTYSVVAMLDHTNWQIRGLELPAGMTTVDLANPPSGVVREYPTRQEWEQIVAAMVDHFDTASAIADQAAARATQAAKEATSDVHLGLSWNGAVELGELALTPNTLHATLTGNTTVTLPTPAEGSPAHTVTLIVSQDTTGGHSLSLPEVAWAWAVPAVPHQAPGARTVIHLWWNGLAWDGFVAGPNMGYGTQGGI